MIGGLSIPVINSVAIYREMWRRKNFSFVVDSDFGTHKKQLDCLNFLTDSTTEELLYGGAAGGAKSWTGCVWLLFMADQYPETKWFIGREELKRLRDTTLLTFFKVCKYYGFKREVDFEYKAQDHYIQFQNGSRIDLLDLKYEPSDPLYERYGSSEYTGGWIEEGGEINFGAFDTLKSRVCRHMNDYYGLIKKIFVTCNPKKNWLYSYFFDPFRKGLLKKSISFVQSLVHDNPFRESGYENSLLSITDKSKKERLYFGNWDYDDDPSVLMDYDSIGNSFTNTFVSAGVKYISADIARYGEDKTIIILWSGLRAEKIITMTKSSTTDTAARISKLQLENSVSRLNTIVDDDGVGGGVVDQLRCVGFVNGSSAINTKPQENYSNLRSQCYFRLSDVVNANQVLINTDSIDEREAITAELSVIKRKNVDADEKSASIISREEIKKLIGRSPDYASALMMRMWFECKPPKGSAPRVQMI